MAENQVPLPRLMLFELVPAILERDIHKVVFLGNLEEWEKLKEWWGQLKHEQRSILQPKLIYFKAMKCSTEEEVVIKIDEETYADSYGRFHKFILGPWMRFIVEEGNGRRWVTTAELRDVFRELWKERLCSYHIIIAEWGFMRLDRSWFIEIHGHVLSANERHYQVSVDVYVLGWTTLYQVEHREHEIDMKW